MLKNFKLHLVGLGLVVFPLDEKKQSIKDVDMGINILSLFAWEPWGLEAC